MQVYLYNSLYRMDQNMAQIFARHNSCTLWTDFMKLLITFLPHAVNQFVNFKTFWAIIVKITVVWKSYPDNPIMWLNRLLIMWMACLVHNAPGYWCDKHKSLVLLMSLWWLPNHYYDCQSITAGVLLAIVPGLAFIFNNQVWLKDSWLL